MGNSENKVLKDQLITMGDLVSFKEDLLIDFRKIIKETSGNSIKKWFKSKEVRKMLNISPGKLLTLRTSGILPFTRIGGNIYYDEFDIQQMFELNKTTK